VFFKGPDLNHLWQLFLARKNSVAAAQWGASLYYDHTVTDAHMEIR